MTDPISAGRCVLRPLRASDAGLIALHCADLRVARMTARIPHPYPPGAAEDFLARAEAGTVWAIDGAASGLPELCGCISLTFEIAYWVAPSLWRQGIALGAVRALVAANPHDADRIEAGVFQDNEASARVLIRAGFVYEGEDTAFSVARGAVVPTWRYASPA